MNAAGYSDSGDRRDSGDGRRLRLGVLDCCQVPPGKTGQEALFDTLELAPRAESLGYSRYWLAEHHEPTVAHGCPELLAVAVAGLTRRIRVGTAGVLLRYYSPLKVAKDFRLLHALFTGRIDLGIAGGRAPEESARGLLGGPEPTSPDDGQSEKVGELLAHLSGERHPVAPLGVGTPEVWVLGSRRPESALSAGRHGT